MVLSLCLPLSYYTCCIITAGGLVLSSPSPDAEPLGIHVGAGCGAGTSASPKPYHPTALQRGPWAPKGDVSGDKMIPLAQLFCAGTVCPARYLSPAAFW